MNTKYTTKALIENYLLKNIDASFNTQIDQWIVAMSRHIDKECKRNIWRDTEETILYDGDGTNLMIINDVIDPVVELDGEVIEVFTYPTTKPYTSRIVRDQNCFTKGRQNVSVTGKQSMSDTLPDDIQFACTVLVAGIVRGQIFADKIGTTEKIGLYSITYKDVAQKNDIDTAMNIIKSYKRFTL